MANLNKRSICCQLKTKTAGEIANKLGVTKKVVQHFIDRNGISITKIRNDHAVYLLNKMDRKYTAKEMAARTGFSLRKVMRIIKENGIKTKFSNQLNNEKENDNE